MEETHEHIINLIKAQAEINAMQYKTVMLQLDSEFQLINNRLNTIEKENECNHKKIERIENSFLFRVGKFADEKTKTFYFVCLVAYLGFSTIAEYFSIKDIINIIKR